MSDKSKASEPQDLQSENTQTTARNAASETEEAQDRDTATEPAGATGDAPDPGARIAALEEENQTLRDRVLRTMAEMENLRRRTEKEKADASLYAIAKFARDMLTVADNLARALQAVPAEARENADEAMKALIEGVELTQRDMLNQFERHQIRRLDPKGEKFDPNFHQAMFEVPDPSVPNGTVKEVVQEGYVIGERVLRPALVGVAKGGPKAPPADEARPQEAETRNTAPEEEAQSDTREKQPRQEQGAEKDAARPRGQQAGAGGRVDRSI